MLAERLFAEELMDDPALPADTYAAVLRDLAAVNRVTLAARPTLAFLAAASAGRDRFSLLDVGYGQGDMLRAIARWADRRGLEARLIGIDLNPRSEAVARAATAKGAPIRYLTGDYRSLAGSNFDFIVSSLVAHHMDEGELLDFLSFMETEAKAGWFVNDLHRHGLSYRLYPLLARLMRWHPIVRKDGQTSIARSFRKADWTALLARAGIASARIEPCFPFRLCVARTR